METSQDVQNLYNALVKALKSGVFDTPEEVLAVYNSLTIINNQLNSIVELKKHIEELKMKNVELEGKTKK